MRLGSPGQGRGGHGLGHSEVGNWARLPSPWPGDRFLWIRLLSFTMSHMPLLFLVALYREPGCNGGVCLLVASAVLSSCYGTSPRC